MYLRRTEILGKHKLGVAIVKEVNLNNIVSHEDEVGLELTYVSPRAEVISLANGSILVKSNSDSNPDVSIFPGGRSDEVSAFDLSKPFTVLVEISSESKITNKSGSEIVISITPIYSDGSKEWNKFKKTLPNQTRMRELVAIPVIPETNWKSAILRIAFRGLKNSGTVVVHKVAVIDGNYNLDSLINSKFGNILTLENSQLAVKPEMVAVYGDEINKLVMESSAANLVYVGNIEYKAAPTLEKVLSANQKKDYTLQRDLIRNSQEEDFPLFGIDRNEFSTEHRANIPERYELVRWLVANQKDIKKFSQFSEGQLSTNSLKKPIFVYWAQGFENAPEIIKLNIERLRMLSGDYEVHLLSDSNYRYYVDLPEYVNKLLPDHMANWTDILRAALLAQYGGVWIDATVYVGNNFSQKLDAWIQDNHVLAPRYGNIESSRGISSWFIAVAEEPGRKFVNMVYETLLLYMKTHDQFAYYFMFHAMWNFLIQLYPEMQLVWKESRGWSAPDSHQIQLAFYENKSDEWIDSILEKEPVQKLTYKYGRGNSEQWTIDTVLAKMLRRRTY